MVVLGRNTCMWAALSVEIFVLQLHSVNGCSEFIVALLMSEKRALRVVGLLPGIYRVER